MELKEAICCRHSVRQFTDQAISDDIRQALRDEVAACNKEGNLNIQLAFDEPGAFSGRMAHYGHFQNVRNYAILIGPKTPQLEEKLGYYGERIVIRAQQLGINSCWVGLTYSKSKAEASVGSGERFSSVIAFGYGVKQGNPHTSKPVEKVATIKEDTPDWFRAGVEAALLAPTAMNQQKFHFEYLGEDRVKATVPLLGFFLKTDLGIVKYHFEIGAGRSIKWE